MTRYFDFSVTEYHEDEENIIPVQETHKRIAIVTDPEFVTESPEIDPDDLPDDFEDWQTYDPYATSTGVFYIVSRYGD